jgi:hypothetical protein
MMAPPSNCPEGYEKINMTSNFHLNFLFNKMPSFCQINITDRRGERRDILFYKFFRDSQENNQGTHDFFLPVMGKLDILHRGYDVF